MFACIKNIFYKFIYIVLIIYLLIFVPSLFGYKPVVVISKSMEPTLKMGSILYYHKQKLYEFKEGDILVFKTGIHTVSHRIVNIKDDGFVTKGDANNSVDASLVKKDKVLGVGTNWCIPLLGYFADFIYNHKIFLYIIIICILFKYLYEFINKRYVNCIILFVLTLFILNDDVYALYETNSSFLNSNSTSNYHITVNLNGGTLNDYNAYMLNNKLYIKNPSRIGYNFNGWTIQNDLYTANWIDNVNPVITSISMENLGYFDPNYGAKKGWNIRITVNILEEGSGVASVKTWLVPYGNGSGGVKKDGSVRILENVLYLNTSSGRTLCASVTDLSGNYTEKCQVLKI